MNDSRRHAPTPRTLDRTAPFVALEYDSPRAHRVAGGRHLTIVVSTGSTDLLGSFGRVSLDSDQVLLLAPATDYEIRQPRGQRTWAAFVHERLAVDLLQWRHQTAGGRLDVWQHLRTRNPPYWRGIVHPSDHASLLEVLMRAASSGSATMSVWDQLESAAKVVRRVDSFIARSFDADNFVRVSRDDRPVRLRREVARAKAFIEARHTEPISTTTIAEHAGLSSSALTRAFQKELGATPPEYLRAVRVARFEDLLVESDKSIREVARLAGLSSTGHLREHINQKYGMSPRELRARLRQPS